MRAGARTLSLLSVPLNVHVLQALGEGPMSLIDLRRAAGSPPQSTMRKHLRGLEELGVLERRQQSEFPGTVDYELLRGGRDLLAVSEVATGWLGVAPGGGMQLGAAASKSAIKALVDGWNSGILRAIAARPMTLTELNRLISALNYPSLERRLAGLRLAQLIEACPGSGRGTPYMPTEWLRQGMAVMAAAVDWERRSGATGAMPISKIDVEALFLLSIPTLRLPSDLSGSCRLAVEVRNGPGRSLAGVLVELEEGRIVSCLSRLGGRAGAWASGSAGAWLDAVLKGEADGLEIGGDCGLALGLLGALQLERDKVRQPA